MYLTPRGIQNLNNTCFANSVLQALLSSERFSKGLESIQHNRDKCSAKRTGEKLYMIITILVLCLGVLSWNFRIQEIYC